MNEMYIKILSWKFRFQEIDNEIESDLISFMTCGMTYCGDLFTDH